MATKSVTGELVQRLKQSGFWRSETEGAIYSLVRSAMYGGLTEQAACTLVESVWIVARDEFGAYGE